ncbi:ABC transporter permease [Pseudomarimonas salicorniae]|uniref:ABC transporter permease n=1 Tax=Pseudomarimonas salicorniae TaxID=2933270 RepID=A0ABT0GHN9_9GAMM|nr:ABC transporter permease [Lysobacter sp. CAU 1642]MCK7593535.1 ABC transporter permease [Lysobacter sp. CAU 1642]
MIATLARDLRHALRSLLQQPGFVLVAVLTLALGIGANTAVYSVIHAALITPLPYAEPERLVRIWETTPEGGRFSTSDPNYLDFAARNRSFESLAAVRDVSYTLLDAGDPVRLEGHAVSANFFRTLGVAPRLGSGFPDDATSEPAAVVVLGHAVWSRHFGADPGVIGREVRLEGRSHRVVGVMGPEFEFAGAGFWVPWRADPASDRGDHWLAMVGRLRDGVSLEQASEDLSLIAAALGNEHPASNAGWGVELLGFPRWLVGDSFRQTVQLLFAAVGSLLLMACVNLANLLFVRNQRRRAEIGLRAALGAGRGQLARLMLAEITWLVLAGVLLALPVAHGLIQLLKRLAPAGVPRLDGVQLAPDVFGFCVALGVLTGILLALLPVWQAQRVQPLESLRGGERGGVPAAQRRLGDALVVGQVALAMVLLVGAGLLISSFMQLRASDPGFRPGTLLSVELQLGDRYAEPWQKVIFFDTLQQRLRALPGVVAVGATTTLPFSGGSFMNTVTPVERAAEVRGSGLMQAHWRAVTPELFETLSLPLLRGRTFDASDRWDGPRWVVVSRSLAEQAWPGEDPVGREIYWGDVGGRTRIVAGVVGDYQDVNLGAEPEPVLFLPYNQLPWPKMALLIETRGEPGALIESVRGEIQALDPTLPLGSLRPLRHQVADAVAEPRLRSSLMGAFAAVALLLAAIGIYGVMAANVTQRRRELGLRVALGARPDSLVALLLSRGMRLAALGIALGLVGSWALTRLIDGLLYATSPLDPLTLSAGLGLLLATVLLASYLPARRALGLDPMLALRHD